MFSRTDSVGMMPSALRSSGIRAMPAAIAARGDPGLHRRAGDLDRAAVERVRAEDGLRGLGPAGAEQAGQPHDLAGAHVDRHVVEHVAAASGRSPRSTGARLLRRVVARRSASVARATSDIAAEHHRDELEPRDLGDRSGVDQPPVAQHGDRVAEPEDLVEPVPDVDDRDAVRGAGGRPPPIRRSTSRGSSEEVGSSMMTTRCIGVDRAGDGDHLLDAEAQLPSGRRTSTSMP